jgi:redox-sensitive bicupin YhaK (pirin superfamily)
MRSPPSQAPPTSVEMVIVPRTNDIGGFEVRRALPSSQRRMVGPFVFFDQMGPGRFRVGEGLDVRPHPHIGLATLTYVFEGEILHRDSLGTIQTIQPGALNWMVAGKGIVHSERTPPALRPLETSLFGIQAWIALPKAHEETAPSFQHHPANARPMIDGDGVHIHLITGQLFGERSPVATFSEMFYAEARLDAGARLALPAEHEERAIYVVEGRVAVDGTPFEPGQFLVLKPSTTVDLAAPSHAGTRLMLLGGATMDGPRHVYWNFVSSSRERIEHAKADWRQGRFEAVPDETDFIPLPPDPPPPVAYP